MYLTYLTELQRVVPTIAVSAAIESEYLAIIGGRGFANLEDLLEFVSICTP
jgi:hypothetical protein